MLARRRRMNLDWADDSNGFCGGLVLALLGTLMRGRRCRGGGALVVRIGFFGTGGRVGFGHSFLGRFGADK